ncbi:hypothetical protein FRC18_012127 [Serendipita sp. 400]|nr:hypothetical protein FRC18_012127 [Serendipita sp. 400]
MRLSILTATLVSAITLTVAAPTAEAGEPLVPLDKREPNGASCYEYWGHYGVTTWGSWDNDWGKGFLDNLRGQCGNILNWAFSYSGSNGYASFSITGGAASHCVENAIWLASNPTGAIWGVSCTSL